MMDNSFDDEEIEQYKLYASAFFDGVEIDVITQGSKVPGKAATVPKNFYEKCGVKCRERDEDGYWTQY